MVHPASTSVRTDVPRSCNRKKFIEGFAPRAASPGSYGPSTPIGTIPTSPRRT